MNLETIKAGLPDYAKDLRLNLDSVLSESGAPGLSAKQIAIIALASAIASRYEPLTQAIAAQASAVLDAPIADLLSGPPEDALFSNATAQPLICAVELAT